MDEINSQGYWEQRFNTNWEALSGMDQTIFFAQIALRLIPDWIKKRITQKKLSICDFGCAMGQAVETLHNTLCVEVLGVDFAKSAIDKAKKLYPDYRFFQVDFTTAFSDDISADIGYISNVLEHIPAPWKTVENILKHVNEYLFVLIPFRETLCIKEHCNIFNTVDIPLFINDAKLIFLDYFDCAQIEGTLYADRQILLIYAKDISLPQKVTISNITDSFEKDYQSKISKMHEDASLLERTLEDCQKHILHVTALENQLSERNNTIAVMESQLKKHIEEFNEYIARMQKELTNESTVHKEYKEYAEKQMAYMRHMIYCLQLELDDIHKSFGWKITKPIRYIKCKIKRIVTLMKDKKELIITLRRYKFFRFIQKLIPKSLKTRIFKRYFRNDDVALLQEKDEQSCQVLKNLEEFEGMLNGDERVVLVLSGVKYIDSEGQRNIRLIHEMRKMGVKVVFAYWRWAVEEEIPVLENNIIKIPIDVLDKIKISFFERYFRQIKDKCFLIEFPHPCATQLIEIASSFGWKTVYDVIDDWEEFSRCGQANWYNKKVECRISNIVDANIATAHVLKNKIEKGIILDKPYYVISNGVDPERMKKSPKLPEYNHSKGVLQIGYFGHLTDAWFDWSLVKKLAINHSDWTFHIIGYGQPENLLLPDNIILYGKKPSQELPLYAAYWDVAIIPFINSTLTKGVNPIKVFEYLQLGLPTVAADMPEIQKYPYVYTTTNYEEFENAIIKASTNTLRSDLIDTFIAQNTWRKKCEELLTCIDNLAN